MNVNGGEMQQIVHWHRELPPIEAEAREEHVLEASSRRVLGGFAHRDDLWVSCQSELMGQARARLEQEVVRLGGATRTCSANPSTHITTKRPTKPG